MLTSPSIYLDMAIDRQPIVIASQTLVISAIKQMNQAIATAAVNESGDLPLLEARAGYVLVVDFAEKGLVSGIFSNWDVLRLLENGADLHQLTLGEVTQPIGIVVQRSQISDLPSVQRLMEQFHCRYIPILDDSQRILGVISQASMMWANQKLTEARLSNAEAQKTAILTAMPDLIYRISDQGIYLESFASNYVTDLLPATVDPISKHLNDVLPKHLADRKMQAIQRAIATDTIQSFEQHWVLEQGIQYEEVQVVKVNDQEALTIIRNISDRKQAELALRESEMRFRSMFDHAAVAIGIANIAGKHIANNPAMCQMLGYSESELRCFTFQEITHPDDLDSDLFHYQQLLNGNIDRYHIEKRFRHKNGEFIWGLMSVSLVRDSNNKPLYDIALIQNINELKATQQQLSTINQELELKIQQRTADLAESELRKRQILNAIPDLLLRLKRDGTCLDCIMPKTPDQGGFIFIKQHISEVLSPEIIAEQMAAFDRAIATGEVQIYEHKLEKHGKWIYEEVRVSPCGADEVLVLIRNISDRKQAEANLQMTNEKLIATNHELERMTRLKDEFLATMSHELRTPLNAIMGISEGLMDEVFGKLNSKQLSSLATVRKSGAHLLELINDILDVAKIEAGMFTLDLSAVCLELLCNSTVNFIKHLATRKNIKLSLHIDPLTPAMITVDERRMRQILINLLSNAVKFTPAQGKVNLDVQMISMSLVRDHDDHFCAANEAIANVDLSEANGQIHEIWFTVSDTGIGIAESDVDKLFQPFVQIDSNLNRQYAGTGLGLNLVKRLTELHGGHVSVSSQLDQGSSFIVKIPLLQT